jgi:hypothetical protein
VAIVDQSLQEHGELGSQPERFATEAQAENAGLFGVHEDVIDGQVHQAPAALPVLQHKAAGEPVSERQRFVGLQPDREQVTIGVAHDLAIPSARRGADGDTAWCQADARSPQQEGPGEGSARPIADQPPIHQWLGQCGQIGAATTDVAQQQPRGLRCLAKGDSLVRFCNLTQ